MSFTKAAAQEYGSELARAVLEQSKALTTLVAQLAAYQGDSMQDFASRVGGASWDILQQCAPLHGPQNEPRCECFGTEVSHPPSMWRDLGATADAEGHWLHQLAGGNGDELYDGPNAHGLAARVFNAHKNETTDRQIGDRRWMNAAERHRRGPSKHLPTGSSLTSLHCMRGSKLVGCATDRKDRYHRSKVTERAFTTVCHLRLGLRSCWALEGCKSFGKHLMSLPAGDSWRPLWYEARINPISKGCS